MFLNLVREKNPNLIKAAVLLHQNGVIPPNTYVLDADNIERNVKLIRESAKKWNLSLYFMLKQNRNPQLCGLILDKNKKETVCVDTKDAKVIWDTGNLIGHVGHLVQTPDQEIEEVLLMQPEVITVFSVEKAKRFSEEARKLGMVQDLLLRVTGKGDIHYPSMEGGIKEENLEQVAKEISKFKNVRIVGVTNFPCMYHNEIKVPKATPNLETSVRCAEKLKKMGFPITQVNAPGNSCTLTMETYAKGGATHIEPGSDIVGSTPFSYGVPDKLPEIPSIIYVTEVLHKTDNEGYIQGGGLNYIDDNFLLDKNFKHKVLFGRTEEEILDNETDFIGCAVGGKEFPLDYYGLIKLGKKNINIGDTVILSFRAQTFATRCANTALVRGTKNGNFQSMGVYDHCCHRLQRWP